MEKPTIHPLVETHIRELRERWGVVPTLSEAIWIVQLCDKIINPIQGERLDLVGMPYRVGSSNVWLWPLTIGAGIWFEEFAVKWWGKTPRRMFYALAFALAHARKRDVFSNLIEEANAQKALEKWAISVVCSKEELGAAIDEIMPPPNKLATPPNPIDWDLVVGEIEAATGIGADHWIWERSREATMRAWGRSRSIIYARANDGNVTPITDSLDDALHQLALAKAQIIADHKKAEASNG